MRRGHTAADYLQRVDVIKRSQRRLSLTSDIIVGFPGESEADFENTLQLVRNCQYDGLFIFKYSKRAGTPAASLEDVVPEAEKTARERPGGAGPRRRQRPFNEETGVRPHIDHQ